MKILKISFLVIAAAAMFVACGGIASDGDTYSLNEDYGEVNVKELVVKADSAIITLPSYGLSSYCREDNSVYAYNYKEHSIDILDLTSDSVCVSIRLADDGPNAVIREPHWMQVYSPDSIAVFDFTAIKLLDSTGKVFQKIKLDKETAPLIVTNSRSNIAGCAIDFSSHTVLYTAMDMKTRKNFEVVRYDYLSRAIVDRYPLGKSKREGKFGYMTFPNVSFNGDFIVYNYPFENCVNVLDMSTGNTQIIKIDSSLTPGEVEEYKGNSADELGWYGAENYFYSSLEYLPAKECYVRVTLGKTSIDRGGNYDKAYYDRPISLTVFDREFKPTAEYELPRHKYNPFCGWCSLNESLAFYNDNMFSELESSDIVLDIISF